MTPGLFCQGLFGFNIPIDSEPVDLKKYPGFAIWDPPKKIATFPNH